MYFPFKRCSKAVVSNLFKLRTGKPWASKLQTGSDRHTADQQSTLFYTEYYDRVEKGLY